MVNMNHRNGIASSRKDRIMAPFVENVSSAASFFGVFVWEKQEVGDKL